MPNRVIFYVDGFNLYHGLHEKWGTRYLWLDLVAVARSLRPASELIAVKYFTASVLNDPGAQSRQDTYIDALKAAHPHEVQVTMGRYQQKTRVCRNCGKPWVLYEEKETDVNIAVTLLADAVAREADSFIVISGDSDIAPAVRMARMLNPEAFFSAAFPPNRYSAELKALMPASFHIGRAKIAQSLLPDAVPVASNSTILERPAKWR